MFVVNKILIPNENITTIAFKFHTLTHNKYFRKAFIDLDKGIFYMKRVAYRGQGQSESNE